jgi:hypothetical protein
MCDPSCIVPNIKKSLSFIYFINTESIKTTFLKMTGVKIQETTNEIAKKALLDLDIFDEENDFQNAKQIFFAINSSIQR